LHVDETKMEEYLMKFGSGKRGVFRTSQADDYLVDTDCDSYTDNYGDNGNDDGIIGLMTTMMTMIIKLTIYEMFCVNILLFFRLIADRRRRADALRA